MKNLLLLNLILILFACSTTKESTENIGILSGTWRPIKQQMNGQDLPSSAFENQKLAIVDTSYLYIAESIDKGMVEYKNGKMYIYGREGVNAGKHFTAIYKLENGELSICYNLKGDSYPNSFITTDNPNLFLSVFLKE